MTMKQTAIGILALGVVGSATAQDTRPIVPPLSFQSSQRQMWQSVLLVSAAVGVLGLVQGDSTLTLLGGAGVLLALYQTNRAGFQLRPSKFGIDVVGAGPVSVGIAPFGQRGFSKGMGTGRPAAYVQATFKF